MSDYLITVSQLNEYVNNLLVRDPLLKNIRVSGEISGFKRHTSGHLYFSLKDDNALVRCVMFNRQAMYNAAAHKLKDGMQVIIEGSVALYAKDGQYQFYVKGIEIVGEGELYRRFMLLKSKLQAEGLFDSAKKRRIPVLPRCVGVITSETGAVFHDICSVIQRRFPKMNILLYPVQVQGIGAAEDMIRGIAFMNGLKKADVLILARGGGSIEDLWAFNNEALAYAIYNSELPVISAVGHETDFTISDFVADLRAPTPSAAAELCVPHYFEIDNRIGLTMVSMSNGISKALNLWRAQINSITGSAAFKNPVHKLDAYSQTLDYLVEKAQTAVKVRFNEIRHEISRIEELITGINPQNTMKRGYAIIKNADNRVLSSAHDFVLGERVNILMHDGSIGATTHTITMKEA